MISPPLWPLCSTALPGRRQAKLSAGRLTPNSWIGALRPNAYAAARPEAVATGTLIDTGHYRVRHDRIDPSGVITLRHSSRLHHIGMGRRHGGTRVLVRDRRVRVLNIDGELLRERTLDPSRDYQPQARP